jgi:hypothetical protein
MAKVYPATFRVSHDGQARLSADLVVAAFVTVTVDSAKQTFTLRPATEDEQGRIALKYYGNRQTPIMHFRRKLKELALTPYEARGTYRAKRVGDVVIVDMRQKVVPKNGALEPRKSQRWRAPYRHNSALGVALAMCREGTTIFQLEKVAEEWDVKISWLLYHVQSKWSNDCECVRNGEKIRLFTPAEWRRRQQRQS